MQYLLMAGFILLCGFAGFFLGALFETVHVMYEDEEGDE